MPMFRDLIHFSLNQNICISSHTFVKVYEKKIRWSGKVKVIVKRKVKIPNTLMNTEILECIAEKCIFTHCFTAKLQNTFK